MNLYETNWTVVYQSEQFPASVIEISQWGYYRIGHQRTAKKKRHTMLIEYHEAFEFSEAFQYAVYDDQDIDNFILKYIPSTWR